MSETPNAPAGAPDGAAANAPALRVIVQYLKDLSFENPKAPDSFKYIGQPANTDFNIGMKAKQLDPNRFEVELTMSAHASSEEEPVFIVECTYAGVFELQNIPAEQMEMILYIECPRMLFPFARNIIAEAVRDGGYQQFLIEPIDFVALYQQQVRQRQQEPAGNA